MNSIDEFTIVTRKKIGLKPKMPISTQEPIKPKNLIIKKKASFIPIKDFIDKTTICRFGKKCNKPDCKYNHNPKTRMCKFAENCKNGTKCTFAHSESEIYVPECRFGKRCTNEKCTFKHVKPLSFSSNVSEKDIKEDFVHSDEDFPKVLEDNFDYNAANEINMKESFGIKEKIYCLIVKVKGDPDYILKQYENFEDFQRLQIELFDNEEEETFSVDTY